MIAPLLIGPAATPATAENLRAALVAVERGLHGLSLAEGAAYATLTPREAVERAWPGWQVVAAARTPWQANSRVSTEGFLLRCGTAWAGTQVRTSTPAWIPAGGAEVTVLNSWSEMSGWERWRKVKMAYTNTSVVSGDAVGLVGGLDALVRDSATTPSRRATCREIAGLLLGLDEAVAGPEMAQVRLLFALGGFAALAAEMTPSQ